MDMRQPKGLRLAGGRNKLETSKNLGEGGVI